MYCRRRSTAIINSQRLSGHEPQPTGSINRRNDRLSNQARWEKDPANTWKLASGQITEWHQGFRLLQRRIGHTPTILDHILTSLDAQRPRSRCFFAWCYVFGSAAGAQVQHKPPEVPGRRGDPLHRRARRWADHTAVALQRRARRARQRIPSGSTKQSWLAMLRSLLVC
ncbi:hypothetical protein BD289DRAFT_217468 [Coniella lustricola]|uniref:Uncharacterized protein n=1 Tax=Coniella lustricola TaxID=2025994 RepID=A0A2T3ABC6_9PEZI|nr:hypothetical protein BD289DRAFT_217468 [Coniella lustricola]